MITLRTLLSEGVLDTAETRTELRTKANREETVFQLALENTGARLNKQLVVGTMTTTVSSHPSKPEVEFKVRAHVTVHGQSLTVEETGTVVGQVGSSGLLEVHVVRDRIVAKHAGKEVWNEKVGNRATTNTLTKLFKDLRSSNVLSKDEKIVGPHGPSKPPIGTRGSAVGPYDSEIAG